MAIFVIADLHLSSDGSKSMQVFGHRWKDYMNRIRRNWCAAVGQEDTVVLPGDISWALKLEDTVADFNFLDSLPGRKLIGKGNHDFWWATAAKMKTFFAKNGWESFDILYNNAYRVGDRILCGTRGWFTEETLQNTVGDVEHAKIVNREVIRLRMSLEEAKKLQPPDGAPLPVSVFLHFPPIWNEFRCPELIEVLSEYGVRSCYFGHIHGVIDYPRTYRSDGINFHLVAADYLNFAPLRILEE